MAWQIFIEVVDFYTDKVVKEIDVTKRNERDIDRIERGLNINLNHEQFFTRVVERSNSETNAINKPQTEGGPK